jgi:hypothetical protein
MRHAFEVALAEAERGEPKPLPASAPPLGFAGLASTIDAALPAAGASHSLWEFAAAWTPEADPPPPPPEPPRLSARAQDIADELALAALHTPAEIARARRRFMWDNHPDRRGDLDRALANQRVATANMLLDRALAALMKRKAR